MLLPALPPFLLPAAALLLFPLRLWSDARAAAADQLRQAQRLFSRVCHPELLLWRPPVLASEFGSAVGVAAVSTVPGWRRILALPIQLQEYQTDMGRCRFDKPRSVLPPPAYS